jgi:RNA-directed DNA polymerase
VAAHAPPDQQVKWLGHVVRGYFNYHAVPMNFRSLAVFRVEVAKRWRRVLSRRSQRGKLNWAQMTQLMNEWLPRPRILHPWPSLSIVVRDSR